MEIWTTFADIKFNTKSSHFNFLDQEEFEPTTYLSRVLQYSRSNIIGISERLGFNIGIGFHKVKFNSNTFEINQNNLTLPININYSFLTGKLKPFLNLGFVNIFNIGTSVTYRNGISPPAFEQLYRQRLEDSIGIFQFKVIGGGGLKYSLNQMHYLLYVNYGVSSGINQSGVDATNRVSSKIKDIAVKFGVFFDLQRK